MGEPLGRASGAKQVAAPEAQKFIKSIPVQEKPPIARPPVGETFTCNSSGWKHGVPGDTTFSMWNTVTVFGDVCRWSDSDKDLLGSIPDLIDWIVVNSVEATATGGGRTHNYVDYQHKAALVGGRLLCHIDDLWTIAENKNPLTVNLGCQDSANQPRTCVGTFDIDSDGYEKEHKYIAEKNDRLNRHSWPNDLVYYWGATIPTIFNCKVLFNLNEVGSKYLEAVRNSLAAVPQNMQSIDDNDEMHRQSVLAFVEAVANTKMTETEIYNVMFIMGSIPGKDAWANVMHAGYYFNKAREKLDDLIDSIDVIKSGYEHHKAIAENAGVSASQRNAASVELNKIVDTFETKKKEINDILKAVLGVINDNDAELTGDEMEIAFVLEDEIVNNLIKQLDSLILGPAAPVVVPEPLPPAPPPPATPKARCGDRKVNQASEQCDPPGTVKGDKRCNNKCQWVDKPKPPPKPVCGNNKVEKGEQCDPPGKESGDKKCNSRCQWEAKPKKKFNIPNPGKY